MTTAQNTDYEASFRTEVIDAEITRHQEGLFPQQSKALEKIVNHFYSGGRKDIALVGCAGAGKSYVAQRIIKCISAIEKLKVALVAPTHKATGVLEDFAYSAGLRGVEISTIHSALHVIPQNFDANGNQLLKDNSKSQRPHLRSFDLAVIDECSMVCPELHRRVLESNVPVIWLGDSYQLPYVSKSEEDLKLNDLKLSPTFTDCEQVTLTEVLRYSGAVAQYAQYIRENITVEKLKTPRTGKTGNLNNISNDDWEKEFIRRLKDDPKNVRAICYSHIAVRTLAKKARAEIYKDDADYHVGEIISAKEIVKIKEIQTVMRNGVSISVERDRILMHSCEEGTIVGLHETKQKIPNTDPRLNLPEIPFHQLDIETNRYSFTVFTPTSEALKKVVRPYFKLLKDQIDAAPKHERPAMWAKYYESLELMQLTKKGNTIVERIQYAGVLTIHQSQGSGFKTLFMNCRSTFAEKNPELRNRLLYTGITRAKEELFINLQWDNQFYQCVKEPDEMEVKRDLYNQGLGQYFYCG